MGVLGLLFNDDVVPWDVFCTCWTVVTHHLYGSGCCIGHCGR